MHDEHTDFDLIRRIQSKDSAALEQLYDKYEQPMYSFAYRIVKDRMLAEEVIQELFMRIWNSGKDFDQSKGKLSSWMFAVTRNIAIDLLRKQKRRVPAYGDAAETTEWIADPRNDTEKEVENRWVGESIQEALAELNQDQRDVVDLIYFHGYTQHQVSEMRDVPLGTVKSRVRLAFQQLRRKLGGFGKEMA